MSLRQPWFVPQGWSTPPAVPFRVAGHAEPTAPHPLFRMQIIYLQKKGVSVKRPLYHLWRGGMDDHRNRGFCTHKIKIAYSRSDKVGFLAMLFDPNGRSKLFVERKMLICRVVREFGGAVNFFEGLEHGHSGEFTELCFLQAGIHRFKNIKYHFVINVLPRYA